MYLKINSSRVFASYDEAKDDSDTSEKERPRKGIPQALISTLYGDPYSKQGIWFICISIQAHRKRSMMALRLNKSKVGSMSKIVQLYCQSIANRIIERIIRGKTSEQEYMDIKKDIDRKSKTDSEPWRDVSSAPTSMHDKYE